MSFYNYNNQGRSDGLGGPGVKFFLGGGGGLFNRKFQNQLLDKKISFI